MLELAGVEARLQILVKDEAQTGSGSHKQRAADAVLAAAVADGHDRVIVGSCGNYGAAIAVAAWAAGLDAVIVLPRDAAGLRRRLMALGAQVVVVGGSYEDAVAASHEFAAAQHAADGNVDGPYGANIDRALAQIAEEILAELVAPPAAVWVPVGNGTTLAAIARTTTRLAPATRVVGVTASGQNSILASWAGRHHRPLPRDGVTSTPARDPLVNWAALHGQRALDALHATDGAMVGVADHELLSAARVLGRYRLRATPSGAAALAGVRAASHRMARAGVHVAVLTGR